MTNHSDFFAFAQEQHHKNLPFVLYVKPSSQVLIGIFQSDDVLHFLNPEVSSGFIMAPFQGKDPILFPLEKQNVLKTHLTFEDVIAFEDINNDDSKGFSHFISLVEKGVSKIETNHFQKVVLSRQISIKCDNLDLFTSFQKSIQTYPNAFNYLFFHPKVGLWMGATPEQLVKVNGQEFETVALAGTQVFHDQEIHWEPKEQDEQAIVTDYIKNSVSSISDHIQIKGPFTAQAGHLAHIKTVIKGNLKSETQLLNLIDVLHPTPAVCGFPKQEAMQFIFENEGYDRKFYAGFLGEWQHNFETNTPNQTDLFVNLRCMELIEKEVVLYVGCGITRDSHPEKEFWETYHKSQTMRKILIKKIVS